jgi:hypothetical protein
MPHVHRHVRTLGHDAPVPDATSLTVALQHLVPLRIGTVEFQHGSLTVIGERWSLAVVGQWVWRREGVLLTGWDQPAAEDAVWDLCGVELLGVDFPDPSFAGDCSFGLADGTLDVRSDRSGWETWTFRHDNLDVVFVGL